MELCIIFLLQFVKETAIHSLVILGDPGAVSRVDKMFVVKVYCKIETSPWALNAPINVKPAGGEAGHGVGI